MAPGGNALAQGLRRSGEESGRTFDEEQPHPPFDGNMLNLENGKRNQAAEGCSEQSTTKEDGDAEAEFAACVKQCEIEDRTGEEACFKGSAALRISMILARCLTTQLPFG